MATSGFPQNTYMHGFTKLFRSFVPVHWYNKTPHTDSRDNNAYQYLHFVFLFENKQVLNICNVLPKWSIYSNNGHVLPVCCWTILTRYNFEVKSLRMIQTKYGPLFQLIRGRRFSKHVTIYHFKCIKRLTCISLH